MANVKQNCDAASFFSPFRYVFVKQHENPNKVSLTSKSSLNPDFKLAIHVPTPENLLIYIHGDQT